RRGRACPARHRQAPGQGLGRPHRTPGDPRRLAADAARVPGPPVVFGAPGGRPVRRRLLRRARRHRPRGLNPGSVRTGPASPGSGPTRACPPQAGRARVLRHAGGNLRTGWNSAGSRAAGSPQEREAGRFDASRRRGSRMKTVAGPTDRIVVVGAGLSGLAAALHLTGAGRQVTVFERADHPGGRVGHYTGQDYRIDSGATVLTLPELVDEALAAVGHTRASAPVPLEVLSLTPSYHARFADGSEIRVFADEEAMAREVARTCGAPEAERYRRL